MNWFRLLKYICKDIDNRDRMSFWNNNIDDGGTNVSIPIIAWDKIVDQKVKGNQD